MKIISIVGARPQFIKAAIVSAELRKQKINEILLHTGQHYDFNMSGIFFEELNIYKPKYNLGVGSGLQGEQTAKMLSGIERVLLKEKPHLVLVYGDTNSTLAGALATVKLHIPVAHVEAGLRSFNRKMPEEINRVLTDHSSTILFAPTKTAVENLKHEGITKNVYNVGDVMFDIALKISRNINEKRILDKYNLTSKGYILTTIHRAANADVKKNLENIIEALKEISKNYKIFFPVHPRTKNAMKKFNLLNDIPENLILNEPVSYKEMIALEKNAKLVITDSGGVQKESYFFKVPCIIIREETEWVELVDAGWNKLTGMHKDKILEIVFEELRKKSLPKWEDFYGGGKASERIARILTNEEV
jgi:UDP-GlcNAc3NAcA epimerase